MRVWATRPGWRESWLTNSKSTKSSWLTVTRFVRSWRSSRPRPRRREWAGAASHHRAATTSSLNLTTCSNHSRLRMRGFASPMPSSAPSETNRTRRCEPSETRGRASNRAWRWSGRGAPTTCTAAWTTFSTSWPRRTPTSPPKRRNSPLGTRSLPPSSAHSPPNNARSKTSRHSSTSCRWFTRICSSFEASLSRCERPAPLAPGRQPTRTNDSGRRNRICKTPKIK
mmetsp:Transcript_26103/g.64828  ORF Transcript_26103/g.64828 Transcript_26103/m.64828 type:complete len:226 (-) Transcript_26103:2391-3068(-)